MHATEIHWMQFGRVLGRSMMKGKQGLESFVARIWLERGSNGDPLWRGHIRHVQDNQEAFFQDFETMIEFLERVSGVSRPRPTGGPAAKRKHD